MQIKDKVRISNGKGAVENEALFDTGATHCILDRDIAEKANITISTRPTLITLPDGRKINAYPAMGDIEIAGCKQPLYALVPDTKPFYPITIGILQMEAMGVELNPKNGSYTVKCRSPYF